METNIGSDMSGANIISITGSPTVSDANVINNNSNIGSPTVSGANPIKSNTDINRQPIKTEINLSALEQGVIIGYDFNNNRMAIKKYINIFSINI